jgi:hypothetical protein
VNDQPVKRLDNGYVFVGDNLHRVHFGQIGEQIGTVEDFPEIVRMRRLMKARVARMLPDYYVESEASV